MVLIMAVMVLTVVFLISCGAVGNLLSGTKDVENKLFEGIITDNLEIINEALNDGANINNFSGRLPMDSNPLWLAFKHSPSKRIPRYLINRGADVNIPNENGNSLLGWQVTAADVSICELLIKKGANVRYENKKGYTALEYVLECTTRGKNTERNIDTIITIFLDHGLKIRPITLKVAMKGGQGQTATFYQVKKRVLKGLLDNGYKSGLDPVLEAAILNDASKINPLIASDKMKKEDEKQILFSTAAFGNIETIRLLIDHGLDLETGDKFKQTPLIISSKYGNLEMVKYLVSRGADIEARTTDNGEKKSALYYAIENNQYDVAKYLIKMGADIKPYKLDIGSVDVFSAAWENGNAEMMKLLLDNGYKSDKSVDDCLFINALKSGDPKELKKYMGYKYNGFDYTTALSTYGGKLETLKFLVENGAKVNSADGDKLILSASARGDTDIVEYLVNKGANVNAVTVGSGGDVAGKKIDLTLYSAIVRGNFDIIKLLLENGADIEQKLEFSSGINDTPLIIAAGCGSKHILEYLLQKGAEVNYQNAKGESALMMAAYVGRLDNVKILIDYKADKSLKDNNGLTAVELAKEKKHKDIADFLEVSK